MKFGCVVTHWDWTHWHGSWGLPSIYLIMDRLWYAGIDRVYWRLRQSQCLYPSRIDLPGVRFDPDNIVARVPGAWNTRPHEWEWFNAAIDYASFDPVTPAVARGHELGMEVYGWLEQAESHGWGWESGFSRDHPQWLTQNRDGVRVNGTVGWCYPEVIEFKVALLREVLSYGLDGVAVDFQKGGDHRFMRVDSDGNFCAGYDPPAVEAFRRQTGRDPYAIPTGDPEWVQFRADYVTGFMRAARELQRRWFPGARFGAFGIPMGKPVPTGRWHDPATVAGGPQDEALDGGLSLALEARERPMVAAAGALEGNLEDQATWVQEGLVDFLVATAISEHRGARHLDPPDVYRAQLMDVRSRVDAAGGGRCGFGAYLVAYGLQTDQLRAMTRVAADVGAEEVVFFESNSFELARSWEGLREVIAEYKSVPQSGGGDSARARARRAATSGLPERTGHSGGA